MAEEGKNDELDLGVESKGGSKKKLMVIVLAAVLVIVAGGAAAYFWLLAGDVESETTAEGVQTVETAPGAEREPPIYHALNPVFVVNLEGRPRTLQVGMDALIREPELAEFMEQNDPMIRDRLLSLLMAQQGSKLKTRAGKQALQSALLQELRAIVKEQGAPGEIEALYFTSFVMQ